jgi:hypothetical protein
MMRVFKFLEAKFGANRLPEKQLKIHLRQTRTL